MREPHRLAPKEASTVDRRRRGRSAALTDDAVKNFFDLRDFLFARRFVEWAANAAQKWRAGN